LEKHYYCGKTKIHLRKNLTSFLAWNPFSFGALSGIDQTVLIQTHAETC